MRKKFLSQQAIVFVIFLALFFGLSIFVSGFFRSDNLLTLLQNVAVLGILSLAMAVVVIGRGVDISIVASMAIPPALLLQMVQNGHSLAIAAISCIALTLLFSVVNGWLVAYAEVPPLFTTLASGLFIAGAGQVWLFQLDTVQWPDQLNTIVWLGRGSVLGVPNAVVVAAFAALVVGFVLRKLTVGAFIYGIGDNPLSARATGIPTRPVVVLQYVLAALLSAFAGVVMAASVNSMPTRIFNSSLIYDVILVVVLGGIGLTGGRGGVLSVIVGTVLIGTLLNGMTILDVSYSVQNLIKGVVLLVAIIFDSFINPRNEETAQQGDLSLIHI